MWKSKIRLLEQIWAQSPYDAFFLGHPVCLTEPRFPKQELVDRARDVEVAQVGEAGLTFGNDSFSLDSLFHRDL